MECSAEKSWGPLMGWAEMRAGGPLLRLNAVQALCAYPEERVLYSPEASAGSSLHPQHEKERGQLSRVGAGTPR